MIKTMLELIAKTKADIIENLNDISRDFVNDNDLEQIDYLSDLFHEEADNKTSVYYADQRDYYNNHPQECENALLELYDKDSLADIIKNEGLDSLICKAGACGEYEANLADLYEDEDEIKEALTLKYLEEHKDDFEGLKEGDLEELLNQTHHNEPDEIMELLADIVRALDEGANQ